jgi:tetratricopeptide (TPR) repeat protein
MSNAKADNGLRVHLGIAEQGKLLALRGRHTDALIHYREAMRMALSTRAPAVFYRHYLECALESLEHKGAFEDLVAYCEKALAARDEEASDGVILKRDRAALLLRLGVGLFRLNRAQESIHALDRALELEDLPLAQTLRGWLRSGLHVSAERLHAEQARTNYFSVRPDSVSAERAIELPRSAATPI